MARYERFISAAMRVPLLPPNSLRMLGHRTGSKSRMSRWKGEDDHERNDRDQRHAEASGTCWYMKKFHGSTSTVAMNDTSGRVFAGAESLPRTPSPQPVGFFAWRLHLGERVDHGAGRAVALIKPPGGVGRFGEQGQREALRVRVYEQAVDERVVRAGRGSARPQCGRTPARTRRGSPHRRFDPAAEQLALQPG